MTRGQSVRGDDATYLLQVRVGLGHDVDSLLGPAFGATSAAAGCVSMATAKQGMAIEAIVQRRAAQRAVGRRAREGAQP